MAEPGAERIKPLTPEERRRGLAAIDDPKRLHRDLTAKYGCRFVTPSWKLLHEAREERSQHLG
jgi:hypothetical protein